MLSRTGQLPVRTREQRVGPRAAPQVQHDGTIVRARAPLSAASVICCRCLAQLAILFLRGQFFLPGRAFSPAIPARMAGENSFFTRFWMPGRGAASGVRSNGLCPQSVFAAGGLGLNTAGFQQVIICSRSKLCDGDSFRVRARGARGGSEPGAVYRPSALRENGDSCARDPGQHAGDTVLRQHRLQAGSAHL